MVVDVERVERYWYPDDGGEVWLAGYQVIDPATGDFLGRDAPALLERGLRVAPVAGAARHHAAALDAETLAPGWPLALCRDPGNEHDANAIGVFPAEGGEQAGWVPRELAAEIAPEIDAGADWTAIVLREQRPSPRDPRTGLTMLLARGPALELRVRRSRRGRA